MCEPVHPRLRFRPAQRVRAGRDYAIAQRVGRRFDGGVFAVWAHQRGDVRPARLGVIASRAVGSSVARHRAKRLIREIFRRHQHLVPPGWDLVVVTRASLLRQRFARLEERFLYTLSRLGEPPSNSSANLR